MAGNQRYTLPVTSDIAERDKGLNPRQGAMFTRLCLSGTVMPYSISPDRAGLMHRREP
jgi:hypothetical protein